MSGLARYAPSVDHSNARIQADVKEYIKYLMDEVGFQCPLKLFLKRKRCRRVIEALKAKACNSCNSSYYIILQYVILCYTML